MVLKRRFANSGRYMNSKKEEIAWRGMYIYLYALYSPNAKKQVTSFCLLPLFPSFAPIEIWQKELDTSWKSLTLDLLKTDFYISLWSFPFLITLWISPAYFKFSTAGINTIGRSYPEITLFLVLPKINCVINFIFVYKVHILNTATTNTT